MAVWRETGYDQDVADQRLRGPLTYDPDELAALDFDPVDLDGIL